MDKYRLILKMKDGDIFEGSVIQEELTLDNVRKLRDEFFGAERFLVDFDDGPVVGRVSEISYVKFKKVCK